MATVGDMPRNFTNATDMQMQKYMKDDRFFPYFGFANKLTAPANNYHALDEENYVLPDAYTGSNVYLRNIIISQVQEAEMWGTKIAMPWKKQEGSMEIAWDEWHFNDTLMTRTPEEAVSRLLNCHFESNKSYTVRFGIALLMEHGFWKTEKGQQQYALQLIQIRNAIAFTAQYGVTLALLNPPKYIDDNEKYLVKANQRTRNQINNWFQEEIDEFACFNKQEDGWTIRLGLCDEKLIQRNQKTGDMIIVPSNSKKFINNRPENKWHFLSGGIRKFDKSELTTGDGRMVVESIMHKMGEHQPSSDPCYREQVIGGFFHMLDHHLGTVPLHKFRTCMLDTLIYSEDKDDMYKMSYAQCVRTLGLFENWVAGHKVGSMPITQTLGVKVFEGVNTWGEVLERCGKLELFMRQLDAKDETTYRDFLSKFMTGESDNDEQGAAAAANDEMPDRPEEPEEDEQAAAAAQPVLDSLPERQFPETVLGHRQRLATLMSWLHSLDADARAMSIRCDMHNQVAKFVQANKDISSIQDGSKQNLGSLSAALAYETAWAKARDLLVLYDLELASHGLSRRDMTAVEIYIKDSSSTKSWGGLSEKDHTELQRLQEDSPYWKPQGKAAAVVAVSLVAPEHCAADRHSDCKTLDLPTQAFTLSSRYLCIFSLSPDDVKRMLAADNSAGGALFGLAIHWPATATNTRQLLARAALLQFNIVMSAMYATLQALSKSDSDSKKIAGLAEVWIKLAAPVHMLTNTRDNMKAMVEQAAHMHTLDYQAPIDKIVIALRSALVSLYTAALNDNPLPLLEVVTLVSNCLTAFVFVESGSHTLTHGAQAAPGGLFKVDDPMSGAFFIHHPDFVGSFKHSNRPPPQERADVQEQRVAARRAELVQQAEQLRVATAAIRSSKPTIGTASGPIADNRLDVSPSWTLTYIKLMGELKDLKTAKDKPAFEFYLERNEYFINYAPQGAAEFRQEVLTGLNPPDNTILKFLSSIFKADATNGPAIETQLTQAIAMAASDPTLMKINPNTIAMEWTRLWSTKSLEVGQLLADLGGRTTPDTYRKISTSAVTASLLLRRFHWAKLYKVVAGHVKVIDIDSPDSLPFVTIFSGDRASAKVNPLTKINMQETVRLKKEVLRHFLMSDLSISDGYFWKWCIENDMIQAIGLIGFRPAARYEMGTMIVLSAWGATGNTFYGHADMMLADDASKKMHYGHFTYNSKSQVLNSRKIVHGRNVVCKDYHGGNGHKVWDASDPDDLEDYSAGEMTKDVFFVPVMINHEIDTNHMDITGSYHPDIGAGEEANKATHYDSAAIYRKYWGWRNNVTSLKDASYNAIRRPRDNTIVFQEHQHQYNPGSGKMDLTIMNKGHWGDRVYPGCGKARRGVEMYLKPVKYDNTNTMGFAL
jgi:hypothetical protein